MLWLGNMKMVKTNDKHLRVPFLVYALLESNSVKSDKFIKVFHYFLFNQSDLFGHNHVGVVHFGLNYSFWHPISDWPEILFCFVYIVAHRKKLWISVIETSHGHVEKERKMSKHFSPFYILSIFQMSFFKYVLMIYLLSYIVNASLQCLSSEKVTVQFTS